MLFSKNLSKEASTLTKWLVSIPSVAHAKGPSLINQAIYEGLREFPYFKNHQEHLTLITHDDGTYDDEFAAAQARRHSKSSVVALVKSLEEVSDTLVLLCDTDTSSPYHYGMFKGSSTSCDELALKLRQLAEQGAVSSKIEEILQSDSGLFGLGILESKCATGAMIAVLKELSDNYVHLNLNILFVCTSESSLQHRGIKQCIPFIQKLCTQENLKLRLAVNAKPNTPTGRWDDQLHIYAGSYGKVEPSFYIIGHSATAFRPYAGFSASIIASELIRELELNPKLTQRLHHQPLVPTFDSLRVKEFGKDFSPDGMQVSFSLPLLDLDLGALLEVLKEVAATAIEHAADLVDQREASFAKLKREDFIPETKDAEVISFSDLVERAKHNFQGNLDKALADMVQKCRHEGLSLHQASITIIERLNEIAHLPRPSIVIYYTDNYVPPMGLEERSSQDRELYMMLEGLIARMKQLGTIVPSMAPYYAPTDGNFLRPVGVGPALRTLNEECPVRAQELSTLNVPTITLGIAGDDLTLLTEHVDRDMCEYLPKFLLNLVDLLAQPENALQLEYHNDLSHHLAELGKKAESIASASVREIQTINQQNASTGFYAQVSQGTLTPHSLSSFLRPSATSEHDARPALEHKDAPLSLPLASAEARADFVPTADLIESGDATTTAAIETVEAEDVTTVPAHATARDPARDAAPQLTLQESAARTSENADKNAPDATRSSAGKDEGKDEDKGEGKGYLPLRAVKSLFKKAQEAKQALEDNIQAGSVASDSDSPLHAVAAHHYKGTGKQESATATPSAIDVALEAATAIAQMVNQEQDQAQAQAQLEPEPADIDALPPFAAATPAASKSEPAPKTETKAADSQAASDAQTTSERDDEEAELVVTPVASAVTAKPATRPEPKSKKGKKKNAKQKAGATRAQRAAPTAAADGVTAAGAAAAAAEAKADVPQAPVSEAPAPEAAPEPVTTAEPQATEPKATEPELALAAVTEMPTIESESEPEPQPEPEPLEERAAAAEEQPTAPSPEASAETSAESSAPADAAAVGATQQAETANSTPDTAAPTSTADATADATRGDADTAAAEADAAAASDKMAAATAHRSTEPDAVVEPDNEAKAKSAEPAPETASEQPALAANPAAEAESETEADSPAAAPAAENQADATQPPAPDHEAERPARAPDASAAPEDAPPQSEADAGADSKPQDLAAKADEATSEVAPQDLLAALAAAPVIATATSAQTESGPAPTDFFAQAQAAHPTELTQAETETQLETEPEATSAETTHALAPEAKSPKAAAAVKPEAEPEPEAEAATEAKAEPPAATSSASEPAVAEEAESEPSSAAPDLAADTASEHAAQDADDTDLAFEEVAAQSVSTELTAAEASTDTNTAEDANAAAGAAEDAHAPESLAAAEGAPNAAAKSADADANADANTDADAGAKSSAESRADPKAAARDKEPALATALPAEAAAAGAEPAPQAEDAAKKAASDAAAPAVGTELKQAVDSAVDSIESALSSSLSRVSSFFKGKGKSKNKLMSSLNKLQEHVKESIEQEKPKAEHHILTSKEPELNLDSVTGPKAQHTLEPELSAVTAQPLVDSAPATSADEPIEPSGAESAAEVAAIAQVAARSANSADSAGLASAAEAADPSAADAAAAAHEERLARELEALVQEDSASDAATDAVIAALHQGDDHAKTIEVVTPPKPDFDLKSLTIATVAPEPQPEKETEPKVKAAAQPGAEAAAQDVAADTSVSGNTIITRSPVVKPSKAVFISAKEERKVEPEAQAEPENKDRTAQPRPEVNADMVAQLMAEAVEQKFKAHKLAQIDAPRSYQESAQPFADGVYANDINVDLPSSQIFDPTSDTALEADALSQEIQAQSSDPLQLPDGNASVAPTVAAATEARPEIQGFAPDADAKLEEASALNQLFAQAQKELQGSAFTRRRHDAAYAAPDLDAPFAPDAPPPEAARADNDSAFYEFAPDRAHAELSADDLIAASAQVPVAPVASAAPAEPTEPAPRPVPADFETEIATEVTVATSAESNAASNTAVPTLKRYDPAQAYAQLLLEDDDEYQAARPSVRTSVREQQAQVAAQRAHAKQQALDAATEAALGDMMNDDFAAPAPQDAAPAPRGSRTRPGAKRNTPESELSVSARRAALHRAMYGDEMPQAQASSTKLSATRSSLRSAAPAANTTSSATRQRGSYIDLNQHGDVVSYNPEAFGQVQRNASTVSASHASGAMTEAANRTAPLAAPFDALAQGTVQGAMQGTVSAALASTLNFGSSRLSTTRSPINPSTPRATSASASATSASNASARRAPLTSSTSATKSSSLTRTSHPHNRFGPNSRLGIMDDDPLVGNAGRSLRPTQRSANTTLRPTSSTSATTSAKSTLTRPSPAGVTSTVSATPATSRPSSLSASKRPEAPRSSNTARTTSASTRPLTRSMPNAGTKVETLASSNPGVRILRTTSPQQATAPKTVRPRNEVVYSKGGAVVISQRITADQASTFLNQNHESKESHEPTAPTAIAGSTLSLRRSAEQSLNTSFKRLQEDKNISGTIVIRSAPNKRK